MGRETASQRNSKVRHKRGGGEEEEGGGSLRRAEYRILVVKSFVVLYCFGPAILKGKGGWIKLFLYCSIPLQISFLWCEMQQDQLELDVA